MSAVDLAAAVCSYSPGQLTQLGTLKLAAVMQCMLLRELKV